MHDRWCTQSVPQMTTFYDSEASESRTANR